MGFFDLKVECSICGKNAGLNRYQIKDKGWVCSECFKKAGFNFMTPIKAMSAEDVKSAIALRNRFDEELKVFSPTKVIGSHIEFDDTQKKWLVSRKNNPRIFNYSDIIDFELLDDGESITKGGIGRAVAGGMLFGGVGAIVGGATGKKKNKAICKSLRIKITINDIKNPSVFLDFISSDMKKDGFIYKNIYNAAQECLSTLQLICSSLETPETNNNSTQISSADEILKYKNLLDSGIITQEEFEAKKKQLLGL